MVASGWNATALADRLLVSQSRPPPALGAVFPACSAAPVQASGAATAGVSSSLGFSQPHRDRWLRPAWNRGPAASDNAPLSPVPAGRFAAAAGVPVWIAIGPPPADGNRFRLNAHGRTKAKDQHRHHKEHRRHSEPDQEREGATKTRETPAD